MRTLFLDYFAQSLVLGLAVLALLAAAPFLQKRYSARWFCRAWLALAVLLALPLRAVLPEAAPATVTLTPPPALLAVEEHGEAPVSQAAVPGPDMEHSAVSEVSSGQAAAPGLDQPAGQEVPPFETGGTVPGSPAAPSQGEVSVIESPSPLAAFAPLDWLALLWLTGALGVAGWQWFGYFVWRRMALRRALPADENWQAVLREALARQPLAKQPRLLASPDVTGAMAAGFFRPVLLVPEGAQPGTDGAYLLAHELTHLQRHDLARKALFSLVLALHWYNPSVWLLAKRAGRDMETACDEAVLTALGTEHRAAYCDALLHAVGHGRAPALTTCFSLTKKDVKARFARLWDTSPKRRGAAALAVFCLAAALAGALVACNAAPRESGGEPPVSAPQPSAEPATDLSTDTEVWPSVYYSHNGVFDSSGALSSVKLSVDLESMGRNRWSGYASPDQQYLGLAVPAADAEHPGLITLWSSADGGESWTSTPLDCSAWIERMAEAERWEEHKQSVFNKSVAWAIPNHYQFVSPEVGFLVFYGHYEYGPADKRFADTSSAFVLLRTLDGGESWQEMCFTDGKDIGNGTSLSFALFNSFAFLNENVGFLCAHGEGYGTEEQFNLLRTTDGGQTWQQLDLSGLAATLPGAPLGRRHVCGALGCSTGQPPDPELPQPDLITSAEAGFAAFLAWGDNDSQRFIFYTRDFGESWQWMYRTAYQKTQAELAGTDKDVWPVGYYNSLGPVPLPKEAGELPPATPFGYASPDLQYAGLAQYGLEGEAQKSLILWNTADGGEHWTSTTLDCSAWLEKTAQKNDWASLEADGVTNGTARVMPSAYQFVSPNTGFLVYYADWSYGPAHNRHVVSSADFVVLRTTNGGESWQQMYSGDGSDFAGGAGKELALSVCRPFLFLNDKVGFLCAHGDGYGADGSSNLLRTTDGGATWQLLDLSAVLSSVPGAPWETCHVCSALGLGGPEYEPDLFTNAQPGFAAFTAWESSDERVVFYTENYGEGWTWVERTLANSTSQEVND